MLSCFSHVLLFATQWDLSLPGSYVHGILQARILEWVSVPSCRGFSQPRDQTQVSYVSCIGRWVLHHWHHQGSPSMAMFFVKMGKHEFQGSLSDVRAALL